LAGLGECRDEREFYSSRAFEFAAKINLRNRELSLCARSNSLLNLSREIRAYNRLKF